MSTLDPTPNNPSFFQWTHKQIVASAFERGTMKVLHSYARAIILLWWVTSWQALRMLHLLLSCKQPQHVIHETKPCMLVSL